MLHQLSRPKVKKQSEDDWLMKSKRENLNDKLNELSPQLLRLNEHSNSYNFSLDKYTVKAPPIPTLISSIRFKEDDSDRQIESSSYAYSTSKHTDEQPDDEAIKFRDDLSRKSGKSPATFRKHSSDRSEVSSFVAHANVESYEEKNLNENADFARFECFRYNKPLKVPIDCTWFFMTKAELDAFLAIKSKRKKIKILDEKIGNDYPKGLGRILVIELVLTVSKFCQESKFSIENTGVILTIYFLTHNYFTSSLHLTSDMVYNYFKEILFLHCIENPPKSVKIFSFEKCKAILTHFLIIYVRNLPLIKFLCLPNYALYLDYENVTKANEQEKIDLAKAKKLAKQKKDGNKKGKNKKDKKSSGSKKSKK